jgi:hypothetical protein
VPVSEADPPTIAVIDIDGVVADVRHRLHHIEGQRRDWVGFHRAADADPVLAEGRELAGLLAADHELVWLSGRPEWLRQVTERWLADHDLPPGRIVLRPNADRRPAAVFKVGAIRRLSAASTIAAVVDDDIEVVEAVRAAGFPAVQAEWLPRSRSDALHRAQDVDGVS